MIAAFLDVWPALLPWAVLLVSLWVVARRVRRGA